MANDGGPAFPTHDSDPGTSAELRILSGGMSLRDWFAGHALAGMMAQSHACPKDWTVMGHGWGEDCANSLNKHESAIAHTISAFAYAVADAMLAERQKP